MKLLLREPGTDEVQDIFSSAARRVSSRLLVPEASGALARASRGGRLGPRAVGTTRELARALLDRLVHIEVDAELADRAWDLAEAHALRGYDAVHLASFERIEAGDAVLVAADGALARAALSLGHAVAVPA